mmetsp:Transcript_26937/g.79408  ORF Transcript_26937/g.79408 Transcript_26937/m.79408 type:complete len:319 (-) Transcript_26937:364-1320(-)
MAADYPVMFPAAPPGAGVEGSSAGRAASVGNVARRVVARRAGGRVGTAVVAPWQTGARRGRPRRRVRATIAAPRGRRPPRRRAHRPHLYLDGRRLRGVWRESYEQARRRLARGLSARRPVGLDEGEEGQHTSKWYVVFPGGNRHRVDLRNVIGGGAVHHVAPRPVVGLVILHVETVWHPAAEVDSGERRRMQARAARREVADVALDGELHVRLRLARLVLPREGCVVEDEFGRGVGVVTHTVEPRDSAQVLHVPLRALIGGRAILDPLHESQVGLTDAFELRAASARVQGPWVVRGRQIRVDDGHLRLCEPQARRKGA